MKKKTQENGRTEHEDLPASLTAALDSTLLAETAAKLAAIAARRGAIENEVEALYSVLVGESLERWRNHVVAHPPSPEALAFLVLRHEEHLRELAKKRASAAGRKAVNARHTKPNGAHEKQQAIRAAWAGGKFDTRDMCALEECEALGMSLSAARKALRNTPNPETKAWLIRRKS